MTSSIARLCVEDIKSRLDAVVELTGKVHQVYTETELFDKTKGLVFPCIGVVYEGMRPQAEPKVSHKIGTSVELVVAIVVLFKNNANAEADSKLDTVDMLDVLRDTIKDTRSPSGHFWKFQLEAGTSVEGNTLVYMQRWATPVQLS